MTPHFRWPRLALAVTIAATCGNAFAGLLTYAGSDSPTSSYGPFTFISGGYAQTARDNFFSHLVVGSDKKERFETGFTVQNPGPSTLSLFVSGGTAAATLTSTTTKGHIDNNPGNDAGYTGRFNTTIGGSQWWETPGNFTVNFFDGVSAFGFYGTDWGDFSGALSLQLFDASGAAVYAGDPSLNLAKNANGTINGSLSFFGFTSDTLISKVVFNIQQSSTNSTSNPDFLGFDDLIIGKLAAPTNNVPEPGTLALAGLSLAALAASRRKPRH